MKSLLTILLFQFIFAPLFSQTTGCTDPRANNYNPQATVNDGSCTYNITVYNPPFRFILPEEVDETSGLIYYNGGYWTMNDSGGLPVIYKLDTVTGNVIQRIALNNASNVDWEDITQDENNIYIGDFGNNSGNRDDLCIYIIDKNDIPNSGDAEVNSKKISFVYEDYTGKQIEKRRYNNFDCEAFLSADDSLYLFSKNWEDQHTRMYRLPKTEGVYTAELLYRYNSAGLITGADFNKNNNEVVLVGYTNKSWVPFMWVLFDFKGHNFFSGNKRRIDMPNVTATQTEGITYVSGKRGVISSEGRRLFSQTMFDFSTAQWTDKAYAGVFNNNDSSVFLSLYPNPLKKSKLYVTVNGKLTNRFQITVHDTSGKLIFSKSYPPEKQKIKIKFNKLKKGTYIIKVMAGEINYEKKFVKL